ncbi:MAG: CDP-diacylglycerol--glycerol-3-phosphate 3-phosphatidyltransferase [Ignavibacteriota bacterium]|nr:MAG: CDP-diacylglycerol--glycerol-3-phosphate 3-phosphatidyltransferase [Chlorobiota bacterium]MBE7478272.1 CDP-diacylglycerol--glycerol-3-phosphate 3-phosphatidyltransferase [Ignavibacteriales bacterium]MBL1121498.1 CDP-diacylglycerol--glycerol-3-phosphate 3-phosphatidyltransferase [Ignavibacteriota bacterium]MCC7095522.1 CDP-diacylglycerol--glycerol-3-phosphate 3-phosphatidyltransferase [Ignavibacteriaceae bacterium]MCE7855778.1 CDP-diacylglycerol--glycerol-3-phosphate 3-phosphatidyltransf
MTLPNQLTVLRVILSPVFLFFFLSDVIWMKQVSVAIYIVAALTDWYDGWLARKFNYITSWGKFWDPLADKILTSIAFVGFALVDLIPWWMVGIIVGRDVIVTLLRVFADMKNYQFTTSYYAKWKTMLQMIFLYYLLILYVAQFTPEINSHYEKLIEAMLNEQLVFYIALVITVITFHSGVLYIKKNWDIIFKLMKFEN